MPDKGEGTVRYERKWAGKDQKYDGATCLEKDENDFFLERK